MFPGHIAVALYGDCRDVIVEKCLIHDVDGGLWIEGDCCNCVKRACCQLEVAVRV